MELSIIIIFHNNKREAIRSLYALSKKYQRNIEELQYEVLCIDSNSSEPLEPNEFKDLGTEFIFHQLTTDNPSPTDALQFGIDNSKSENLCFMIDGAHIITPNVINYFKKISSIDKNYFIYTHPYHLGEYYQNDNMIKYNYNQATEDILLSKFDWKENGYTLFEASNYKQSNEIFISNIFESNCFFISKNHLNVIGGINKKFKTKGGGFVNLDIFKRAVENTLTQTTALIGEGSFHQFHGGTSTNSDRKSDLQKTFRKEYFKNTGKPYSGPIYSPNHYGNLNSNSTLIETPGKIYAKIINELNQKKNIRSATEILSILNKKYPFKEEFYISHIKTLSHAREFEQAEELINQTLDINPNNLKLLDTIARHYYFKEDLNEAEIINNKILEIDPINLSSLVLKFRLNSTNKQTDIALQTLNKLKEQSKRIQEIPIGDNLGILCLSKGYIEEATFFHEISEKFNETIDHTILKILLDEKMGREVDQKLLEKIMSKINPKNEPLKKIIQLIKVLNNANLWELGIQLNNKIKQYNPKEQITDYFKGKYLFNYEKYSEAEIHLKKFIKTISNKFLSADSHFLLSKIALKRKDYNQFHKHAFGAYNKIKNVKYSLNYIRSNQFLQNYKPALTILEKVISYENVNIEKIKNLIVKNAHKIGDIELIRKHSNDKQLIQETEERLKLSKDFRPVIFTHIQKCGGTSFRRYLSNAALYSGVNSNTIHIPGQNGQSPNTNLITLNQEELNEVKSRNINVLADHSSFRSQKVQDVIPNFNEAFNLTFFRHPIKRIYSSYYYFYYGKNFKKEEYIDKKLNELSPKLLNQFIKQNANVATAFLSSKIWAPDHINVLQEDLIKAKENLEYFKFIGITEISSISMKVFNKVKPDYFQTPNKDMPLINKGSNIERDRFPNESIKNKIIKANSLDIKLYNYGLLKFITMYKKFLSKDEIKKVKSLKITKESLDMLYK